jgi:uncharacterized protein YndB with AHSA1/START domain
VSTTRFVAWIHAPRAAVYRALVDGDAVARWMVPDGMTSRVHVFDAKVGGALRVSLTYEAVEGVGKTSARTDMFHGHFVELVADAKVVEAIEFETEDPAMKGEMVVTYTLSDARGGTELVATHDGVPPGVSEADNKVGWRMSVAKLRALVEGR